MLPNELLLEICKWMDEKSLNKIRLVNHRLYEITTPLRFKSVFLNSKRLKIFPQHLFPFVQKIKFDNDISTYEVTGILTACSKTLRKVNLYYKTMNPPILMGLAHCTNLEEMTIKMPDQISEWNNLVKQVFGNQRDLLCWRRVRKLELDCCWSDSHEEVERFRELFPVLEELEITFQTSINPSFLVPTLQKLHASYFDVGDRPNDFLLSIAANTPLLQKLTTIDCQVRLPALPMAMITDLTIISFGTPHDGTACFLSSWCRAFPNVRCMTLHGYEIKLGDVASVAVPQITKLTLTFNIGPPVWEIVNSMPNLIELDLKYEKRHGTENAPTALGDFRRLQRVCVSDYSCMHSNGFSWLRRSIVNSFELERRQTLEFTYTYIGRIDISSLLSLLGSLSEVVKSIELVNRRGVEFEPEWLDILSKELNTFKFYGNVFESNKRWKSAVQRLRGRGVHVEGYLKTFL